MKVISVENVSKKFILAHDRPKNLADAARGMFHRTKREDFWALKDVSFDVEQGEALGIIGHNGAGKSTMLKLLTRIMEPTSGRIRTRGRVSALIEVGAGFHPEMTGRENVYLNGSILGMTRAEIDKKFDEIVAFAELEKFIDMPVKRYSSGMYARLGFAVAAHVDPEILIVDEVLSVGDLAFQARCSKQMDQLRKSGVTIVFVSHNMNAVTTLCDRVILIEHGLTVFNGNPQIASARFKEDCVRHNKTCLNNAIIQSRSELNITQVKSQCGNNDKWEAIAGEPWNIEIDYECYSDDVDVEIGFKVFNNLYDELARPSTLDYGYKINSKNGASSIVFHVDALPLQPGRYTLEIFAWDGTGQRPLDEGNQCYDLDVLPGLIGKGSAGTRYGQIILLGCWSEK